LSALSDKTSRCCGDDRVLPETYIIFKQHKEERL
jgi:hypothetical protein